MRAQMPMHWRLDPAACERHLQLSQPSCRAIQKSIETLLPEEGRSKGADRSVRSILGCVSLLSDGCFFHMNCRGKPASPPHPTVTTVVITRCRMYARHSPYLDGEVVSSSIGNHDHCLCGTDQSCTRSKCRITTLRPRHLHASDAVLFGDAALTLYMYLRLKHLCYSYE